MIPKEILQEILQNEVSIEELEFNTKNIKPISKSSSNKIFLIKAKKLDNPKITYYSQPFVGFSKQEVINSFILQEMDKKNLIDFNSIECVEI